VGCCAILAAAGRSTLAVESVSLPQDAATHVSAPTEEGIEFFETHIRPVLAQNCYECHSADAKVLQSGLRLDTAERILAGGDSGAVVVPRKPAESLLLAALRYESAEMPPTGKLPDSVIGDFEKWIAMGAPDPRVESKVVAPSTSSGPTGDPRQHWAFQPPRRAPSPSVRDESAARSDLDRFVLARLDAANLVPSPPAAPPLLLRRLYYDLTGLPPTAGEIAEFAANSRDAHYEAAVDRLLASPKFGERWARHWLDIARYADTKGYVFTEDRSYKHAYTYRDWVIASFNSDRPFDRFIVAQLAGDQMDDPSCAPASGFLTLGRRFLNNQQDIINDRIDVVTRGLLGLTVACARCHDHKYDPISSADYYAMYGVFASCEEKTRDDAPPGLMDAATPYEPYVFVRGSAGNRGPDVDRRFLTILAADGNPRPFAHGSGRREMAKAIASRGNPLTARVWVNRVWGHLFGKPLVATTSDFGVRGDPPTNPELLDWLACELMDDNWSTKGLIRRIVLSSTYRQASDLRAECMAVDAENRLLWRTNRRRLDLEQIRDSLLAVAGRLDETMGGPSVSLTDTPFSTRRSVYGFIERQNLPAFFRTFDFANPNTHTPERPLTTSPQQALFLLNSPFVMEQAIHLAARSADIVDRASRVHRMYQFVFGRDAGAEELIEALEYVDRDEPAISMAISFQLARLSAWGLLDGVIANMQMQGFVVPPLTRWEQLAQVLLMSNEFIYVD